MIKALGRIVFYGISIIIARFIRPKKKVKEVVNVRFPVHKKAS